MRRERGAKWLPVFYVCRRLGCDPLPPPERRMIRTGVEVAGAKERPQHEVERPKGD